jgi:multiple sugar transport system permease protein
MKAASGTALRPPPWGASRLLYGLALLLLTVVALASLMPLYWMITGSLKLQQNAMSVPPELWPSSPTLENYKKLLFGSKPALRWFFNSLVTASGIAAGAVATSSMAGYALAKKEFPGRRVLFSLILVTMILPREVSLVPLAVMMRDLHWFDTYQGLIVPFLVYPFGIFLIRQFSVGVPNDLLDAARIDGAGELGVFSRVVLPLIKPAVAAVAIFAFVGGWNEYLWQLIIVNQETMLTLPVGVSKLVSSLTSYDLGVAMAGATFAFLPMLTVFLVFQSHFVKGITLGSVKG